MWIFPLKFKHMISVQLRTLVSCLNISVDNHPVTIHRDNMFYMYTCLKFKLCISEVHAGGCGRGEVKTRSNNAINGVFTPLSIFFHIYQDSKFWDGRKKTRIPGHHPPLASELENILTLGTARVGFEPKQWQALWSVCSLDHKPNKAQEKEDMSCQKPTKHSNSFFNSTNILQNTLIDLLYLRTSENFLTKTLCNGLNPELSWVIL